MGFIGQGAVFVNTNASSSSIICGFLERKKFGIAGGFLEVGFMNDLVVGEWKVGL